MDGGDSRPWRILTNIWFARRSLLCATSAACTETRLSLMWECTSSRNTSLAHLSTAVACAVDSLTLSLPWIGTRRNVNNGRWVKTNLYCFYLEISTYAELDKYISKDETNSRLYCGYCHQFSHKCKDNVRNHVEAKHFKGHFVHMCNVCGISCATKISLQTHRGKFHKEEKYQRY